jgi:hypothetical protein
MQGLMQPNSDWSELANSLVREVVAVRWRSAYIESLGTTRTAGRIPEITGLRVCAGFIRPYLAMRSLTPETPPNAGHLRGILRTSRDE